MTKSFDQRKNMIFLYDTYQTPFYNAEVVELSNSKYVYFSAREAKVIQAALDLFLDSYQQVLINDEPVNKTEVFLSIEDQLQHHRGDYTVKELIVIKGWSYHVGHCIYPSQYA